MSGFIELPSNGLELAKIKPTLHPKFSPNLFHFLRKQKAADLYQVYRDQNGVLWIGYPDNEFLIGAKLIHVLCHGAKSQTAAWACISKPIEIIPGFWDQYIENGRCAIDPAHSMYFKDDRWEILSKGRTRRCLWCNHVQYLKIRVKPVTFVDWVNVDKEGEG